MATTGAQFPTSGTSVSSAPWSDNAWTTPGNVTADDGSTANITAATYDSPDQSHILRVTGFDFSAIPDGSTIDGVRVVVQAWYRSGTGSNSGDLAILYSGSAQIGNNKWSTPQALTTSNTATYTLGGTTDLWGASLDAATVKGSGFGIDLGFLATAANSDVDVDYVTMEVFYTAPANVDVSATSVSLTLTENAAAVAFDQDVSAGVDSMTLTAYAATVETTSNVSVDATTASLALTANQAAVSLDQTVSASVDSLTLTANPAAVSIDVAVSGSVSAFSLVSYSAGIAFDVEVSATSPSMALAAHNAALTFNYSITTNLETLTMTQYPASVSTGIAPSVPLSKRAILVS